MAESFTKLAMNSFLASVNTPSTLNEQDKLLHDNAWADEQFVLGLSCDMKTKMSTNRAKGRDGWWDDSLCSIETLEEQMQHHIQKGDWLDVSILSGMIYARKQMVDIQKAIRVNEPEMQCHYVFMATRFLSARYVAELEESGAVRVPFEPENPALIFKILPGTPWDDTYALMGISNFNDSMFTKGSGNELAKCKYMLKDRPYLDPSAIGQRNQNVINYKLIQSAYMSQVSEFFEKLHGFDDGVFKQYHTSMIKGALATLHTDLIDDSIR